MIPKTIKLSRQLACLLIIFVLFSATLHAGPQQSEKKAYTFGVLPAFSTGHLIRLFGPIAHRLSKELNRPVLIETAPDFKTFLYRIIDEKRYDIVLIPPHFYSLIQKKAGYQAVARNGTKPMQAVFVVKNHSPIKTLEDLRGKSLSIIDPYALVAAIAKEHLLKAGIYNSITLTQVPSHMASLAMLEDDLIDVASLIDVIYGMASKKIRAETRIISRSKKIQTTPFSVAPWLPESEKILIQNTLTSPKNIDLFKPFAWTKMVVPGANDYKGLERLMPLMDER